MFVQKGNGLTDLQSIFWFLSLNDGNQFPFLSAFEGDSRDMSLLKKYLRSVFILFL